MTTALHVLSYLLIAFLAYCLGGLRMYERGARDQQERDRRLRAGAMRERARPAVRTDQHPHFHATREFPSLEAMLESVAVAPRVESES